MRDECFFLNPLRRGGTSQRQRSLPSLLPSSVAVDERDTGDLLLYVRKHAHLLRYYSPDNSLGGDWLEFFDHDSSILAAAIGATDPEAKRRSFVGLVEAVSLADLASLPKEKEAEEKLAAVLDELAAVLDELAGLALLFDGWYRDATEGLSLRSSLTRLIDSLLGDAVRQLAAYTARARQLEIQVVAFEGRVHDLWELSATEPDSTFLPSGLPASLPSGLPAFTAEVEAALGRLQRLFDRFFEALVFTVQRAPAYLRETLHDDPGHQPHMALFLAFLELLGVARDHLNGLTAQHLDFYYQRVLGLERRAAVADRAHLVFELAKSFTRHPLAADTLLKAGKDTGGAELLYGTDEQLVLSRTVLAPEHGLKTLFVAKGAQSGRVESIHAAPDADSADGEGADLDEEGKWLTFGGIGMPVAEIGFAVASSMLLLAEGARRIELTLDFSSLAQDLKTELAPGDFEVYASGEKDWIALPVTRLDNLAGTTVLTLYLDLPAGGESIVAFNSEALCGGFETRWPLLKVLLAHSAYELFLGGEIRSMTLAVEVGDVSSGPSGESQPELAGVRGLILENDLGILDPAKPFHPFGPVPRIGSSFLIGSHEVFHKHLTDLRLDIEWADLPVESFADHYEDYLDPPGSPPGNPSAEPRVSSNSDFTAGFGLLADGDWIEPSDDARVVLFETLDSGAAGGGGGVEGAPDPRRTIRLDLAAAPATNSHLATFDRFAPSLRQGFLRATLNRSFEHAFYPRVLATAASSGGNIPNPPYTPLIASIVLHYRAEQTLDYAGRTPDDFAERVENVFQIWPFGHREIFPVDAGVPFDRRLVPPILVTTEDDSEPQVAEGTLLIGLDGLAPPENLALLFQVAEGSEHPNLETQEVVWSYLGEEQMWADFKPSEILGDETGGLLTSGIITLAMPKAMRPSTTVLPAGRHWIKASVHRDSAAVPRLVAVHTQAVTASFRDQGDNDLSHLAQPLAAGTVAKLKRREAAVKSLSQPYASFGGRPREAAEAYYVRVSERLRHKGRGVTIFDYERLVLENFPEVYKVRCLNHTRAGCEHAPGHVRVVVVPNLRNRNAVDPLQPRLSRGKREAIRRFLQEIVSDFVSLEVVNPDYQQIEVKFRVRFHPGHDEGFSAGLLEQEIIGFLSPWIQDDAADLTFGGRIHRSVILEFVEQRPYVDFLTDFEMFLIDAAGERGESLEVAEASSSSSALVSWHSHQVIPGAESCVDEEATL